MRTIWFLVEQQSRDFVAIAASALGFGRGLQEARADQKSGLVVVVGSGQPRKSSPSSCERPKEKGNFQRRSEFFIVMLRC